MHAYTLPKVIRPSLNERMIKILFINNVIDLMKIGVEIFGATLYKRVGSSIHM